MRSSTSVRWKREFFVSLYHVDSTADTVAEDGVITLREAIEAICTGMEGRRRARPRYQLSGDYPTVYPSSMSRSMEKRLR